MRTLTPISKLQKYAKNLNGKLLSTEYTNCDVPIDWQCEKGHIWKARWSHIKNGSWCPFCKKVNKYSIEDLQRFAYSKKGKLLSEEYKNKRQQLLWECEKGHQWNATWNNVSKKTWCPKCGNNIPELTVLQDYAINKLGKLLSTIYEHSQKPLLWECNKGHQWNATWNNIKSGGWCPKCNQYKTEANCKIIVERLLNTTFTKHRIYYDDNNKFRFFEIDMFNSELNIGFEYNGEQHYIYPNRFHKTKIDFIALQLRDKEKIKYCKDTGIKLYTIPYTQKSNLEQYIKTILLYE